MTPDPPASIGQPTLPRPERATRVLRGQFDRYSGFVLVMFVVGALAAGVLVAERVSRDIRSGHLEEAGSALVTLVETDVDAYERWFGARSDSLLVGIVGQEVGDALRTALTADPGTTSAAAAHLADLLSRIQEAGGPSLHLVGPAGTVLTATRPGAPDPTPWPGTTAELTTPEAEASARLAVTGDPGGAQRVGVAIDLDPVLGMPGALVLEVDLQGEFARVATSGRPGTSGETYAVSASGVMLTPSRFTEKVRQVGLLGPDEPAAGHLRVADPGRRLSSADPPTVDERAAWPPTLPVAELMEGRSGESLSPYRDYRGHRVVGAWRHSEVLNIGLVSEFDLDEVLAPANRAILVLRGALLLALVLALGAGVGAERARRAGQDRRRDRQRAALLERQVQERTADLTNALAVRDELLRSVSHELRTPLTVLTLAAHTLVDRTTRLTTDQISAIAARIGQHAANLSELVDDLTSVDRLLAGRVTAQRRRRNLASFVHDVVADAGITTHPVASDVPAEPVIAMIDPPKVERLLRHLLDNAVRFSGTGSPITVGLCVQGDDLQFRVDDAGPGFPEHQRQALLAPFRHGDREATSASPGLGLGLTLVAEVARLHGGSVSLGTSPAGGASVRVTIPWIRPEADDRTTSHPEDPGAVPFGSQQHQR